MISTKLLLLIIILTLSSFNSLASDKDGRFAVRNAGMITCAKFVEEKNKRSTQYNIYVGWIDGFLSAANQFTKQTFDLVPWGNTAFLTTLLENHCKKNNEQLFYVAVNKLAASMMEQRLPVYSEHIKIEYNGKTTYVYQVILKKLQEVLKKEKFYKGKPDGLYGKGTRKAIEKFQKSNNLAVTGLPDQLTLYVVFLKLTKTSNGG